MNSTAVIMRSDADIPMGGIMNIAYGIAVYDYGPCQTAAFMKLGFRVVFCVLVSTVYFMLSPITSPVQWLAGKNLADDLGCAYRRVPAALHRYHKA